MANEVSKYNKYKMPNIKLAGEGITSSNIGDQASIKITDFVIIRKGETKNYQVPSAVGALKYVYTN